MHELPPEVAQALADGRGVVALESTLIAHGLPWPDEFETAHEYGAIARAPGAVSATIAVPGGRARIGLDDSESGALARITPRRGERG